MSSNENNINMLEPQELGHSIQIIVEQIKKGYEVQEKDNDEINDELIIKYNDSIILKPDYQREYRSSIEDESSLIESILLGIPIPPIFLASNKIFNIQILNVVDGQHRLKAFYRFVNNKFKLKGLTLRKDLENKSFVELEIDIKQKILSYKLASYVFRGFPGKNFELEIFNRYNKGTKPLTQQEIRNAVYNSSLNEYVGQFLKKLMKSNDSNDKKLVKAYNITSDRLLKKKVHESIFVIMSILENGIQVHYKDSTSYAEEYMKQKSESENQSEGKPNSDSVIGYFEEFNIFLLKVMENIEFPFSKELYGIQSRNYKFQMSIAMIITAIYRKVYITKEVGCSTDEKVISDIANLLASSFIEDPNYKASTTNSTKINELVDSFNI